LTQRDLADATRVSTDRALRSATKNALAHGPTKTNPDASANAEVLEFQPSSNNQVAIKKAATKDSKKSALKNIHGTVYGALDPAAVENRSGGVAAGGSSKSGKSHLYVETERVRATLPK